MSIFRTDNRNVDARVGRLDERVDSIVSFYGLTAERPSADDMDKEPSNIPYFDRELNKPIWFNGNEWVDATGTSV